MKRIILLLLCASLCHAASVTIAESAYRDASGRLATGTITVTGPSFSNGTDNIAATNKTESITNGVFSISLEPNDTADPPFNYSVSFRLQTASYSQQWKVPTVAGPLTIQGVTWSSNSPVTVGLDQLRRSGYTAGDIAYYNGTLWLRLPRGTNGQVLSIDTSLSGYLKWAAASGGGTWGSITGTLSAQTDLASALAAKLAISNNLSDLGSAPTARTNLGLGTAALAASSDFAAASHAHAASDVTSGVFNIARLATGTPNGLKFVRDDGVLATPAGGGDVSGPSSATDNCFARFDGITGKTVQNGVVCADDSGNVTGPATISTGDGTIAGEPKMYEISANGTDYRSWLAPDSLAAILRMKFADAVPTAGQVMRFGAPSTNISAQTWGDASGVGACSSNTWASTLNNNGAPTCTQPGFANLLGSASASQLPNPTSSTKGGVNSKTCTSGDFVSTIGTDSTVTCTTPASSGSSGPSVGYGYNSGTNVTTSNTALCTMTVTGGTMGTGAAANSKCMVMHFLVKNNTGSDNVTYSITYGATTFDVTGAIGGGSNLYGNYMVCNNTGVTNAQAITSPNAGDAAFSRGPFEPSENSTADKVFSLNGRATTTTQAVRVFGCSIK